MNQAPAGRVVDENGEGLADVDIDVFDVNGDRMVPVKRHRTLDRITANELCKQAGLPPRF